MTIQLALPTGLEERLQLEAARRGEPTETVALRLLDENLPLFTDARRSAAIALLDRWMEEDMNLSEQEEASNAAVLKSLDENRPSYRKLFEDSLRDPAL